MVKAVIVFVDVNGKKLDRGSEERDRDLTFKVQRSMFQVSLLTIGPIVGR